MIHEPIGLDFSGSQLLINFANKKLIKDEHWQKTTSIIDYAGYTIKISKPNCAYWIEKLT